jgi:hypothetical protein
MTDAALIDAEEQHHVGRLLEAARRTIAEVRYCWVVTPADDGRAMRAFRIFRRGAVEAPRGARAQQLHFTPMLRLGWPATFADPAQAPDR